MSARRFGAALAAGLAVAALGSGRPSEAAPVSRGSSPPRDIAVTDLQIIGPCCEPGDAVQLRASLANLGASDERVAVEFRVWRRVLEIREPGVLRPGDTATVEFSWQMPATPLAPDDVLPVYALGAFLRLSEPDAQPDNDQRVVYVAPPRPGELGAAGDPPRHLMEPGHEVHQWLANEAFYYFSAQISGADLGPYLGTIADSQGDDRDNLLEGTAAEDKGSRPPLNQPCPFEGHCDCPYYNHFCAGADGSELYAGFTGFPCFETFDSALEQAQNIWPHATAAYTGNRAYAFYCLGHVAHLIGDMTVPAHTHNDPHPNILGAGDEYEITIGSAGNWMLWYYGGGRSGDWSRPLSLPASLADLFYRTANFTEDYDSDDYDGDPPPYYDPDDYPATWHHPELVDRAGGISTAEVTIIGDDLMPAAISRIAELYRLFYHEVDATPPECVLTYPGSADPEQPDVRDSPAAFEVTATANDPESGVVIAGYAFQWTCWDGGAWLDWQPIAGCPCTANASFTPTCGATLYAFSATATNGGGHAGSAAVHYLRIAPPVCRGDCNCDGAVGFADIDYFVAAIPNNEAAWSALFLPGTPPCPFTTCDVDADGNVGFDDIDPFVGLIPSSCP